MCAGFFNRNSVAALVMLALAVAGPASAQKPEKLQISEVPGQEPVLVTNVDKVNPNSSSFKEVKEDLLRPFSSLDPRNSMNLNDFMDNQLPPPPRPAAGMLNRKAMELQDQRRNWAFTLYEELNTPQDEMEKKMFGIKQYGDDGREKKDLSVMERYYESLGQKNLSLTNQNELNARAEFIYQAEFDPLGKTFEGDPFMKKLFGLGIPGDAADKAAMMGLPGASASGAPAIGSPEEIQMQQKRLEELRRSIMANTASLKPAQLGPELATDDYYTRGAKITAQNLLDEQMKEAAASREKPANPFLALDPTANALHSQINDDLTARALGLPQPVKTNSVPTAAPTAQSIQSQLDPFGANRPRPKF